jgi:hypothetical protein
MTLIEIKQAISDGKTVHWANKGYTVIKDVNGQYLINYDNKDFIGLTWLDGVTLNGRESEFFTLD